MKFFFTFELSKERPHRVTSRQSRRKRIRSDQERRGNVRFDWRNRPANVAVEKRRAVTVPEPTLRRRILKALRVSILLGTGRSIETGRPPGVKKRKR